MTEPIVPKWMRSGVLSRSYLWILCVLCYLALGSLTGTILDAVLFQISHDYIYSPGSMLSQSVLLSLFLGCLYAATCTTTQQMIPTKRLLLGIVVISSYSLIASVLVAGVNYGVSDKEANANVQLAPLGRVAFCEGLVCGAVLGAILGTLIVISYQHLWLKRQVPADSSASPPK